MTRIFLMGLFFILTLVSCEQAPFRDYQKSTILTPRNEEIQIFIADSNLKQTQGLSGLSVKQWSDNMGMLFVYPDSGIRRFWMPDTYFALDIFFLNGDFRILHVERNVPEHPGHEEPPAIARTPPIYAQHVLELNAHSSIAKALNAGDQLRWKGNAPLLQTLRDAHPPK